MLKVHILYPYIYPQQSKRQRGTIPLTGLTIYELDNEISESAVHLDGQSQLGTKRQSSRNGRTKQNRILLITATGDRYELEAVTDEERNTWIGELRVAVSSLEIHA